MIFFYEAPRCFDTNGGNISSLLCGYLESLSQVFDREKNVGRNVLSICKVFGCCDFQFFLMSDGSKSEALESRKKRMPISDIMLHGWQLIVKTPYIALKWFRGNSRDIAKKNIFLSFILCSKQNFSEKISKSFAFFY